MLGFFGLMSVLLGLTFMASYWISWDLQHKDYRPSFVRKTCDDFADLLRKFPGAVRNGQKRRRAALDACGAGPVPGFLSGNHEAPRHYPKL